MMIQFDDCALVGKHTLPKTSIAPEHSVSQKEISLPTIHFQGLRMLVLGRIDVFW